MGRILLRYSRSHYAARHWPEVARGAHKSLWMTPVVARVALIYDMSNIFAWQAQPQSTAFDFASEAHRLYQPFWRNGVPIDMISSSRLNLPGHTASAMQGDLVDLSSYDVLLLPAPMLISDALYTALESFVAQGGAL